MKKRTILIHVLVCLGVLGCGDDAPPPAQPLTRAPDLAEGCEPTSLEDDLAPSTAMGRGVDPASGEVRAPDPGETFVVATTYLQLAASADAEQKLAQLMRPIEQQLGSQPGLLAVQFAVSRRCGTARTLSVWRDEESMVEFVASPAHLDAMRRRNEVSRGGATGHYLAEVADELTWQHAVHSLEAK